MPFNFKTNFTKVSKMLANCVPIVVLLCLAIVSKVSSEQPQAMDIFKAGDPDLKRWFDMIASVKIGSPEEAEWKLKSESCNVTKEAKNGTRSMCEAYELGMNSSGCISSPYLLRAECAAVYMYSTTFFENYNPDIRNRTWEPYKVFTSLLYTALKKLSSSRPLPRSTILFRGLKKAFIINTTGRFYFPQFVSTSLNKSIAEQYGNKTRMVFVHQVPKISGNLEGLTEAVEQEVLLTPYEAFEVINQTGNTIYLRSSDAQDFIISSAQSLEAWPYLQGAVVLFLFSMRKHFFIQF